MKTHLIPKFGEDVKIKMNLGNLILRAGQSISLLPGPPGPTYYEKFTIKVERKKSINIAFTF
jgi:hypothetical protein